MNVVVFGLSVSSSWGNGHATLWRGLIWGLARQGHSVVFFERDQPYYAAHRDCHGLPNGELVLYPEWTTVRPAAERALRGADAAMVTSYCPDGASASELVLASRVPIKAFYDLDTPITLEQLARGLDVPYLPAAGLGDFDLVLSYTGGPALAALERVLGARRALPLYGSVDLALHKPSEPSERFRSDLSYLGTYAAERQQALAELMLRPAAALPERKFLIGGSQYPAEFEWHPNIHYVSHVPACDHPAFFGSARLNLNVTRAPMAAMGFCPSGRLFEAAACAGALISDDWPGIEQFYTPGSELLVAHRAEDVIDALALTDRELHLLAARALERTHAEHTVDRRARQLIDFLEAAGTRETAPQGNALERVEI